MKCNLPRAEKALLKRYFLFNLLLRKKGKAPPFLRVTENMGERGYRLTGSA